MYSKIDELIPSNKNYFAIYEDGNKLPVIAWASRKTDETVISDGDVQRKSDVSGLVVNNTEIVFADELNGFEKYEMDESEKEMLV